MSRDEIDEMELVGSVTGVTTRFEYEDGREILGVRFLNLP